MAYPENSNTDVEEVREVYDTFWKELIEVDGAIDIDRVKAELSDFKTVIDNVSVVYSHITNDHTSKPHVLAPDILSIVEEEFQKRVRNIREDDLDMGIARVDTFDEDFHEELEEFFRDHKHMTGAQFADQLESFLREWTTLD